MEELTTRNKMTPTTMRQIMTAALLVIMLSGLSGQTLDKARNPVKGYVITNDNDTIHGTIDYLSGAENAVACHFCPEGKTEFQLFSPDDIQGYRFLSDGVYYVSRTLPVKGKIFAEFLLKGGVSLYRYESGSETLFFMTDSKGGVATIEAQDYNNLSAEEIVRKKRDNLGGATAILVGSTEAANSMWKKDITAENLVDITRRYNEQFCAEEGDCIVYQYDAKKSSTFSRWLRIEAGLGFCRVGKSSNHYNTLMPRLGIGGEFTSARINPNLSLQVMLVAGLCKDKISIKDDKDDGGRLWVELNFGPLYRFSSQRRSTGFVRGGFCASIPMGAYAGAGWEFRLGNRHRLQFSLSGSYQGLITSGSIAMGTLDVAFLL